MLRGGLTVLPRSDLELAPQDLRNEISITAGGLQKSGIHALCFLFHQIQHGVDLALGGKDLAVVRHALSGFHLCTHAVTLLSYPMKESSRCDKGFIVKPQD